MPSLGVGEIAVIAGLVVVLFGAKRIPEVARSLGKSLTEFKRGLKEDGGEGKSAAGDKPPADKPDPPPDDSKQ